MSQDRARGSAMPKVALPSGEKVPVLGMGTFRMGEDPNQRAEEIAALRTGLELGMNVIDTAELHGEGKAEELVGEAIAGRRDEAFLISKVLPFNSTAEGVVAACERSLRRLGTDRLDFYLLHWRGMTGLGDTIEGFEALLRAGKIRYWGVCNFDLTDMRELIAVGGGSAIAVNQIMYNLAHREAEWDLIPWSRQHRIPVMAYSPFDRGRLLENPAVTAVASRLLTTPAQVVLAWTLFQQGMIVLPTAHSSGHVKRNRAALSLQLTPEDRAELGAAFPAPRGPVGLTTL